MSLRSSLTILFLLVAGLVQPLRAQEKALFNVQGIMVHTDLEGGCWYLEASGGKKYELIGSQQVLRPVFVPGRYLSLMVKAAPGRASTCMVGTIVEVTEVLDTVQHPRDEVVMQLRITGTLKKNKQGYLYLKQGKYTYALAPRIAKKYKAKKKFNELVRYISARDQKTGTDWLITDIADEVPPNSPIGQPLKTTPKKGSPQTQGKPYEKRAIQ